MKTTSRILVCVLGAIFIFSSLGAVYAVDPSPTPTVPPVPQNDRVNLQLDMASYYVYLMLRSWGIEIQFNNISEFSQDVKNWLIDIMFDYCTDLGVTVAQWIAPWLVEFDFWGNLQVNDRAVEDVNDFCQWLIAEFNLTDNQSLVIKPIYDASGATLFQYNQYYEATTNDTYFFVENTDSGNQNGLVGFCIVELIEPFAGGTQFLIGISTNSYRVSGYIRGMKANGDEVNTASISYNLNYHGTNYYTGYVDVSNRIKPVGTYVLLQDYLAMFTWMENVVVTESGNERIVTSVILTPENDPDYISGDGLTIIDGEPSYSVIEFSGEVTVSNLPAIVSTGTIPSPGDDLNPGLVNAWHPISTLIEMSADSMGMLIGIVYEFPEEVLIPIFAVLGGIIIFGIIHAMKEH